MFRFIIRDTRFWASQYEFYLFSTIFNKHIFLLQPTNTLKVNDKGEEEWYLNLLSDNFFQAKNLFLPPGRTEPPQTQCFMGLINLEHFVSLRLVPKKKSNEANQPDIPPVNDACNNGNVDPNPPNIPPVNDSNQTNSQFPGKSPNKINGVDTDSSDSDNQVIGNKKENKNAKRKRLLKERMYQKVIERIQQQKDKERLSEKNKTQAGRMLNKQPRGKRLRAPKNTDYYSDASGDIVDDNISIDQPDEILMENLVAKKKQNMQPYKRGYWENYYFSETQQTNFALKLIKLDFKRKLGDLNRKRQQCQNEMAQCVLEENKIKKSSRVVKGKKNLYEALQTKLANIDSEIIQYKWEMKRKPLFHKYDAIYALKKN